ncbi:nuclear transport factor 2 family protein [Parafrankia sp. EAN1pec]|uniref:nuclear transport factor 2 family protein n=1 Tax=Parafrankia sp. (strain EAN1pec) TaxID=298653 RepID=UPI0002E2F34C
MTRQETSTVGAGLTPEAVQAVATAADRVYDAWAATSTQQRVGILAAVCAPDVAYANPLRRASGVQALAELISELRAAYPGYLPARISGVDAHHDVARYDWALRDRSGQAVLGGIEIVRFTLEVRLTSVVSFFGPPPRINYIYQA